MTTPEQTLKIPKTQPSPGDSRQCPTSTAHRCLAKGKLAVLAQLEAVPVDPLDRSSQVALVVL
jgi:hypothetical protein